MHRNRKLNRLQGYDYSRNALYFVTSCVQDRICCLGAIEDGKMVLNSYGQIAERQLGWLEEQYQYVDLHAAVVMPNHIHAIIEINDRMASVGTGRDLSHNADDGRNETGRDLSHDGNGDRNARTGRDLSHDGNGDRNAGTGRNLSHDGINGRNAGTGRDLSLPEQPVTKIKSLSQLMGAYKTTSSKQIHLAGLLTFNWQRSFHDHIIRNEESYLRISKYIIANPSNWKDDKFYITK